MKRWIETHQVLAAVLAAAIACAVWELYPALIVLFVGYLLAASLRPVVDFLSGYIPRILALLTTYIALICIFAGLVAGIAIPLSSQADQFVSIFSNNFSSGGSLSFLTSIGFDPQAIATFMQQHAQSFAGATFSSITFLIAAVVISIYLLYDWPALHASLKDETRFAHRVSVIFEQAERSLGAWVRGQLLLSGTVGLLVFIALFIYGVPFAPVLGALAAITEFIPYVGPILAAVPAVLLGLNVSLTNAIVIVVIYLVIHQLENHLLVPVIMSRSVQLHPVVVIVVMIAGFELLGIAGVILAVPFTALVRIVVPALWRS